MADPAQKAYRAAAATLPRAPVETRTLDVLARLWRDWLRPYWRRLVLNLVLIAVVAGATSVYPLLIKWSLEGFETRSLDVIRFAPVLVIIAVTIKSAALYAQRLLTNAILSQIDCDLQRAMYGALVRADLATLDKEAPAATANRFTTDILVLHTSVEKLITGLIRDGLTVFGLLAALLWIDWELTLYALGALPLAAIPIGNIGRRLRRIARRSQEEAGQMTARVAEGLSGIRLSKTYRLEGYLTEKAGETFESLRRLRVRAADQRARIDPFLEALAGLGLAIIFWVIGARIAAGTNSIGEFMAFVSSFLIAGQSLRGFGTLYAEVQQGSAAGERIFSVLDAQPKIADRPGAVALPRVTGEIRFDAVGFDYEGGAAALRDISLTIPAGSKVALVGRSGAGKTTLMNLIPRLYDATSGAVTIDGRDIRDATLQSLRGQVAVVGQDAVIFDDTVARNIGFGDPDADRAAIEQAARDAQAWDFVAALPEGLDTQAGERGLRFSGGERQRLTIARAMLKDAPILLMDEPTSALDAEAEEKVRQALDRLSHGRTTLVIAHRLSTIRDADMIVAMDGGRIVETGRHEELLARGGLYADLHRLQFREG
ncbi:MAG: ABC transporter permease [Rhodobacteraceae bacterium]|nr:ABC transporter permease [Paracoccaceae bacterium]